MDRFSKKNTVKFHKNLSSGSGRTDGQANMKKLTVSFRNFVNAPPPPKKKSCRSCSLYQKCITVFLHAASSFIGSHFLFKNFCAHLCVCVSFRHVSAPFPCSNPSTAICHSKLCPLAAQCATVGSLLHQTRISQYSTIRSVCL